MKAAPRLAVFGRPIAHSRSPEIHQMFAEQVGVQLSYEKVLVPEGEFDSMARDFLETGLGFNVTIPYKYDAWRFVDRASDRANLAEAVNTVGRDPDGAIVGDNTDGRGLVRDISHNLHWQIEGKRVLLLGAGGAVHGVLGDLLEENPALLHLYNRTESKAQALVERFGQPVLSSVNQADLGDSYDLVVNGTSASLAGETLDLPERVIGDHSQCYDMVYRAGSVTSFNAWCLSVANCQVADGLGMLVEQAALAFKFWLGLDVDTAPVINKLSTGKGLAQ
jgi:shikimate dehydrogenase